MKSIVVGGLEQNSINIVTTYLESVYSDLDLKVLGTSGIAGVVTRAISTPDVVLIVLDSEIYNSLKPRVKNLGHSKVYEFKNDEDLEDYCCKLVGVDKPKKEEISPEPIFNKPVLESEDNSLPDLPTEATESVEETSFEDTNFEEISAKETDAIISKLKDELAQKDMMIRNLEKQVSDLESGSSDEEKEMIAEIRRLKLELSETKEKLETSINSSSELDYSTKAKIEFAEKKIAELNDLKIKVDNYEIQISSLTKQVSDLTSTNENLGSQIEDYSDEVSDLTSNVDDLKSKLEAKDLEIEGKQKELVLLQEKVTDLEGVRDKVENLNSQISTLNIDLRNKDVDINSLNDKLKESSEQISNLSEKIEILENSESTLKRDNSTLVSEKSNLESEISKLQSTLDTKDESIKLLENKLEEKSLEVSTVQERLVELRSKINNSASTSEELRKSIQDYELQLSEKTGEYTSLLAKYDSLKKDYQGVSDSLSTLKSEKDDFENKLISATQTNLELESDLTQTKASLKSRDDIIKAKEDRISELESEELKNKNLIESLETQLSNLKASNDKISSLEDDLLESRRLNSKLSSDLESMKKLDDSGKVQSLKIEVAQLKHKLSEYENTESDLDVLRNRCTDLELQLASSRNENKQLGVFAQMHNISKPKLAYDCKLDLSDIPNNLVCIAGGSAESTASTYQLLRKTCQKYEKRCLILDLSNDSYIDREFGTKNVKNPSDWLLGLQPFTSCLASTKFNNVKVITTGLSYINDLSLLSIDWGTKLSELSSFADIVLIHIGSLNNSVTKILFNTFNSCMKSHIIVNATPINLRATILNLAGLVNLNKSLTTVDCVNFDINTSRGIFQKLASKYNSQICSDDDVIFLER